MSTPPLPPPPTLALAAFLALLAVQRGAEVAQSAANSRRLRARGAVEHGRGHYPLLVALHVLWPLGLIAEVLGANARPWRSWPLWLLLLLAAQGLRFAAMAALGERWTTRVLVLPGEPLLRRGPYRWLRHPSYVAVTLELVAAPLLFGAWRTALAAAAGNLALLAVRVRVEERDPSVSIILDRPKTPAATQKGGR